MKYLWIRDYIAAEADAEAYQAIDYFKCCDSCSSIEEFE